MTVALLPHEALTAIGLPRAHRAYAGMARGLAHVLNTLPGGRVPYRDGFCA